MNNIGRTKYPSYTIYREHKIFSSRDSLLRYVPLNAFLHYIASSISL